MSADLERKMIYSERVPAVRDRYGIVIPATTTCVFLEEDGDIVVTVKADDNETSTVVQPSEINATVRLGQLALHMIAEYHAKYIPSKPALRTLTVGRG